MIRPTAAGPLSALFSPRTVAVVGASDDPGKFGGRVLSYLARGGWSGRVTPVHPTRDRVQGIAAAPRVSAIADEVDLAVLALPSAAVAEVVGDCVSAGVKAAVVFASGFAEAGEAGGARQAELLQTARTTHLRLLGPNCIGVVNCRERFAATFATMWTDGWPDAGAVSIISQSGAMASYLYVLLQARGLGTAIWCSTGNEADIDVAECIAHLAADPHTRVVLAALEGVPDGRRLVAAVAAATAAGKPVILLKLGRSAAGRAAAISHTGSVAGEARVFDEVMRQAGGIVVATFGEAIDLAALFSQAPAPRGRRVAVVSASGGGGIMAADQIEAAGLQLASLAPDTRRRLDAVIPSGGSSSNPVDVTAMVLGDLELMVRPVEIAAADPEVDALVIFLTSAFRSPSASTRLADRLAASSLRCCGKPVLLVAYFAPEAEAIIQRTGLATFLEPVDAVNALARLLGWQAARSEAPPATPALEPRSPITLPPDRLESSLLELLERHGVAAAPARVAASVDEACTAAVALGPVVAMKLVVPGLAHKSESGGVVLGVEAEPGAVARAFERLARQAAEAGASPRVLVQRQVAGVVEVLLATRRDAAFGRVVVVGLGGKWVELLDDVAIRVSPIDAATARSMIAQLRGAPLFHGLRDLPPADMAALVAVIVAFSRLAERLPDDVDAFEVNPFVVGPTGAGGWAVDAKIETARR
ncbi:MAG: acetate--CoA ligase family protein [Lautropia sp.]